GVVWTFRSVVLGSAAEFEDVPLRDAPVLEKLPGRMQQPRGSRSAQRRRQILNRIVNVEVGAAALEQVHEVLAEQSAFVSRGFGAWTRRSFLHGAVSDTNTVLGMPEAGCVVVFRNPTLRNMASYSRNVYASPASVTASMVKLNVAAVGGDTRSSFGTNSRVIALPPGFSAACTRRIRR